MKGIILAGGSGTRLYPLTKGVSKQMLAIYDKPMIYYPLSILMTSGIKDILIISTPFDLSSFQRLLGDGSEIGINICYKEQPFPGGLAQAFLLGEEFIGLEDVCLILGDNIFHGSGLFQLLDEAKQNVVTNLNASVFGYYVKDPMRYGVVEFNENNKAISIEEKPLIPKSNYAVVGLYFYPNNVIEVAKNVKPSLRGELEITAINQWYLNNGRLDVFKMERGYAWLDTGTIESLTEATNFIQAIEKRQGLKIACIEEIAFEKNLIDLNQLIRLAKTMDKTEYGQYIIKKYS